MPPGDDRSRPISGLRRGSLLAAGFAFTGLAVAGVVLPFVPTTPFLLLAAACFARSSPRLYRRLLANRVFGPYIEQWRRDRTVPRSAKLKAFVVIALAFGTSIALSERAWMRATLIVLAIAVSAFVARLPTSRGPAEPHSSDG